MTIDFAGLLDAPAYDTFGETATLTPDGLPAVTVTVLCKIVEVEEAGAGGIVIPTLKPAADMKLADLTAAGLVREQLLKAALVLGGVRYRVIATAPAENLRELRLILIEAP